MAIIRGLSGAPGCASGRVVVLKKDLREIVKKNISDIELEINKFEIARKSYLKRLELLSEKALNEVGESGVSILEAYQEILLDDVFFDKAINRVRNHKVNIEFAINEEKKVVVKLFESLNDEYMKERSTDVSNVCMELIDEIQGRKHDYSMNDGYGDEIIIVAEDLTPVDTINLDKTVLKGFITEKGGSTSHTVILAKTLGIPAVVGVKDISEKIHNEEKVIIYGEKGEIIVSPSKLDMEAYITEKEIFERQRKTYDTCKNAPAITKDGVNIRVNINTGDLESLNSFDSDTCDGVGLFRTEFLYMNLSDYPSEDEQFEVYKQMALVTKGNEIIIRTLDIGGDKKIDYMNLPVEDNPFLGYRAIRLCLDRTDVFKTQLRAILRASAYGNIKIMFPLIVNVEEVLKAKTILEAAKSELEEAKIEYNRNILVGIMIETPAAVIISDILAKEVDFFSIGSNDLIQYTTATDRMNNSIQWLYDSCNISVLRSIKMVCDNARKNNIEVGICGEVASESTLIPLWVAMGINELSVVPAEVGKVKYIINNVTCSEIKDIVNELLDYRKIEDVRRRLDILAKAIK